MDSHTRAHTQSHAAGVASAVTEVCEVLLDAREHDRTVSVQALHDRLPLVRTHINDALDTLVDLGHATVTDTSVTFTDDGYAAAAKRVRRHRLTECMLASIVGMEWWKVHDEAANLTASVSDDLEARIVELLGDPGTCPHGNPIPGSLNRPSFDTAVTLTDAPLGPVVIARITETLEGDHEALQLLENGGLIPGRIAEVQQNDTGWVQVAGSVRDIAVPPHVAQNTYVFPR